jgi:hypothetical protein
LVELAAKMRELLLAVGDFSKITELAIIPCGSDKI